jgi:F-type H+-transporting ATPase subunit b
MVEILGVDLITIGLHVLNVIVLYFVLRWLLYKPVLKFMKKREKSFAEKTENLDSREKELIQEKQQYDQKMSDAQTQAAAILTRSNEMARDHARELIDEAKETSRELVVRARKEIVIEKEQTQLEMKSEIVDMAVQIAEKVLKREVSKEDNKKIIDEFFERVG